MCAPTIRSAKPSPLTSPAEATERPVVSPAAAPLSLNPFAPSRLESWILAANPDSALRDGKRAVAVATKACDRTKWRYGQFIDTLAAAHAEAGNFPEAIRCQEQALALMPPGDPNVAGMRERLALYQNRTAYHDKR